MTERIRQGRSQVDRHGVSGVAGVAPATVDYWHLNRHRLGFPDHADTDDRGRHWFWLDEVLAFHARYLAERAARFTSVDYTGDPDEHVAAPEAARILGYASHRSLTRRLLDNPDSTETLPSGRKRRKWKRRTVWDHADSRIDQRSTGRPSGISSPRRQKHRYEGDPRLDSAIALVRRGGIQPLGPILAAKLGIDVRTARRILAVARKLTR